MTRRAHVSLGAAISAIAAIALLAACQSSGAGSPSVATSADAGATVAVTEATDLGPHLVDAEGRTLYIFLNDSPGVSACTGECATNWPPATVEDGQDPTAGDGVTAEVSTIERDDGSLQLAIAGWPLYRYAADQAAGDTTGEGVGGVWFVARPDGSLPDDGGQMSAEPSSEASEGTDNPYDY